MPVKVNLHTPFDFGRADWNTHWLVGQNIEAHNIDNELNKM